MQWGNTYDKHSVSYYFVALLSHQVSILLQDTTPYVVPEIWENTLPLFNLGQYMNIFSKNDKKYIWTNLDR